MRAGTLRKVGTLQNFSPARDAFGGAVTTWTDVCLVRYEINTTGGREIDPAGMVRAVTNSTITMRYQKGIVAGMRIKSEDGLHVYKITAVNDVNQKHHELELTVLEGLASPP